MERAGLTQGSLALGHCQLGAVTVVPATWDRDIPFWAMTAGFLHDWQEAFIPYGKHDGVKRAWALQSARPSVQSTRKHLLSVGFTFFICEIRTNNMYLVVNRFKVWKGPPTVSWKREIPNNAFPHMTDEVKGSGRSVLSKSLFDGGTRLPSVQAATPWMLVGWLTLNPRESILEVETWLIQSWLKHQTC